MKTRIFQKVLMCLTVILMLVGFSPTFASTIPALDTADFTTLVLAPIKAQVSVQAEADSEIFIANISTKAISATVIELGETRAGTYIMAPAAAPRTVTSAYRSLPEKVGWRHQ